MHRNVTPQSLLQQQVSSLENHTPAVLDGAADGIHATRIATRRIRELLPLTAEWHPPDVVDSLGHRFRAVGRALGRVRDVDVRVLLLKHLEPRIPGAASALAGVRQQQEHRRIELMRKLIKQIERNGLLELMREAMAGRRVSTGWGAGSGRRWQQQLRSILNERAESAIDAVRHATGVYFPHRAHSARIAIKKLRYVLEIAEATRTFRATEAIADLKKAQDILGDLHDRQELLGELGDAVPLSDGAGPVEQIGLVIRVVEADMYDLHARYLARRGRVLAVAEGARHLKCGRRVATPLMIAAGAIALSSGLVVAQSSWRRQA